MKGHFDKLLTQSVCVRVRPQKDRRTLANSHKMELILKKSHFNIIFKVFIVIV